MDMKMWATGIGIPQTRGTVGGHGWEDEPV